MDYNRLGHSGLRVPALSFGTATFGGGNEFFLQGMGIDEIPAAHPGSSTSVLSTG